MKSLILILFASLIGLTAHAADAKVKGRKVASINCETEATKVAKSTFYDVVANFPNAAASEEMKLVHRFDLEDKKADSISVYGFSGSYYTPKGAAPTFRYFLTIVMNSNCDVRSFYAHETQQR